jgi:hypothetical protein
MRPIKQKMLRMDATDAQMKMRVKLARISAQRAQSALCSLVSMSNLSKAFFCNHMFFYELFLESIVHEIRI